MATQTRPRVPIAAMFSGPGSGAYLLPGSTGYRLHDSTKRMNPAFSFGYRTVVIKPSYTPGPAAYAIDKGLTRHGTDGSSKYSLKDRTKLGGSFQTPAPCKYMYLLNHVPALLIFQSLGRMFVNLTMAGD